MSLISKPYTFSTGATIVASEHNSNFDTIYNLVNGNLDNTNIKANAAIDSSKIGAITAASKVSGASMYNLQLIPNTSGVVPVANLSPFATFPVTPSSAPTTNYQVANKKYVDDEIGAIPAQVGFGAWASKNNNEVYLASTDGFVCAYANGGGNLPAGFTDTSNPPTTQRTVSYSPGGESLSAGITMPVKKGEYWKVTGCVTVYWIPLGA